MRDVVGAAGQHRVAVGATGARPPASSRPSHLDRMCSSSSRPISVSISPGDSDTTRPPRAPHGDRGALAQPDHAPLGEPVRRPGVGLAAERRRGTAPRGRPRAGRRAPRPSPDRTRPGGRRSTTRDADRHAAGHRPAGGTRRAARDRHEVDAQDLAPPRHRRREARGVHERVQRARGRRGRATQMRRRTRDRARSPTSALHAAVPVARATLLRDRVEPVVVDVGEQQHVDRRRERAAHAEPIAPAAPVTTETVVMRRAPPGASRAPRSGAADRGPLAGESRAGRRRRRAVARARRQREAGVGDAPLVGRSGGSTGAACTTGAR